MQRRMDQFTTALCAMLVVAALLACKKRTPTGAAASASAAAETAAIPTPPAVTPPSVAADASPKLGEVKRYADEEKAQTGAARILENGAKIFNEADDKTAEVATLDKGLLVFRLASLPDWELVEFPSGVGKVSPGWVQAKFVDTKTDASVAREAVAAQPQQAAVKAVGSAAPKSSASTSASAKPATSASASASAKTASSASASAKPATSALSPIPIDSAALTRAAQLAASAAAQAKAAADKAAAGIGGKAGK